MDEKLSQSVIQEIITAFSTALYPGDNNIGISDPFDGDVVEAAFRGKHWNDIAKDILVQNHDQLLFLTKEAYHFYLLAYLLATLFYEHNELDTIPDRIIWSLTPPDVDGWQSQMFQKRTQEFNRIEREAIYVYLSSYKQLFPDKFWSVIPDEREDLERATQFWGEFRLAI